MLNADKYVDFVIIDKNHDIFFADVANAEYLYEGAKNLSGLKLKDVITDITDDYPLLRAVDKGEAFKHFEADVTDANGHSITIEGAAYPVLREGEPVMAIQFSDFFYERKDIARIYDQVENTFYRANNTKYILGDIITADPHMNDIKNSLQEFALSDANVFIYGATGTGKELVAQAIHNCSKRFAEVFVSQNCGAIPENLLEGILFGTVKGSFTGAEDKAGIFELAEGGTVFLDEINSLSTSMQTKILRAVESKIIRRVGSLKEKKINVRIIAATNERPEDLLSEHRLKPDLYYRLAVIYVELPPLCERKGDVPLLINFFIDYFNRWTNSNVGRPTEEVMKVLEAYSWPGNVRELRNLMESIFALSDNDKITIDDVPDHILDSASTGENSVERDGLLGRMRCLETNIVSQQYMEDSGNLKTAAEHLGISKQLLRYKLNRQVR